MRTNKNNHAKKDPAEMPLGVRRGLIELVAAGDFDCHARVLLDSASPFATRSGPVLIELRRVPTGPTRRLTSAALLCMSGEIITLCVCEERPSILLLLVSSQIRGLVLPIQGERTMSRLKRVIAAGAAAAAIGAACVATTGSIAEAKGKPVTVTLSCTNAVGSASATVQLKSSIFGGTASNVLTLDCGSLSVSGLATNTQTLKATSMPAGFVSYSISQSVPAAGGCAGSSIRPLVTSCNVGITLTVS